MMLKCLVMVRLLITVGLTVSCHSAMSVEDAKKVGASFSDDRPVVVPRATEDVLAILKQEKLDDPGAIDAARKLADEPAPASTDAAVLGEFYFRRSYPSPPVTRIIGADELSPETVVHVVHCRRASGRSARAASPSPRGDASRG